MLTLTAAELQFRLNERTMYFILPNLNLPKEHINLQPSNILLLSKVFLIPLL